VLKLRNFKVELLCLKKLCIGKAENKRRKWHNPNKEMLNHSPILVNKTVSLICPINVLSLLDIQYHIKIPTSASGALIKYIHAPAQERFTPKGHHKVMLMYHWSHTSRSKFY
jgi:hypothetical protein